MARSHVAWRYEFGAAIHETGMNIASAGLLLTRPELFEHSTDIQVKPTTPAPNPSPAHTLTLFVSVNEPVAFNYHPIPNAPELGEGSFFTSIDVSFSLTDSELGTITRIGVKIEAAGQVYIADDGSTRVRLAQRPNGMPWFDIVEFRGEHPESAAALIAGAVDAGADLQRVYHYSEDDAALGQTFRAIVNYLIDLYLCQGLQRTLIEYPLPQMHDLVQIGKDDGSGGVTLGVERIEIRRNSLYAFMGRDLSTTADFPQAPARAEHIRLGASEEGVRRVVDALLPIPIDFEPTGHPSATFQVTARNLHIPKIVLNLNPRSETFPARVHVAGHFNIRVNIKIPVFNQWLRFDVPFPIDKLSHYAGLITPYMTVEDPATQPDAQVQLRLRPASNFFEAWYLFLKTDFANYFRDRFERAVNDAADRVLGDKFCKFPILGWIVCGVVKLASYAASIIGWLVGNGIDWILAGVLNPLINTVGRYFIGKMDDPTFRVFGLDQGKVVEQLGLPFKSAAVAQLDNGRGGELTVSAWLNDEGVPVPDPPEPPRPLPNPTPAQPTPIPIGERLPEHPPEAFQPAYSLPMPSWTNGQTQHYTAVLEHVGQAIELAIKIQYEHSEGKWTLRKSIDVLGMLKSTSWAVYDDLSFKLIRGERRAMMGGPGEPALREVILVREDGRAETSIGYDGQPSSQRTVLLRSGTDLAHEDFWIFRLAHAELSVLPQPHAFGRIEVSDNRQFINWSRQIPVKLAVASGEFTPPESEDEIDAWLVSGEDEESSYTISIDKAGGLLSAEIRTADSIMTILKA